MECSFPEAGVWNGGSYHVLNVLHSTLVIIEGLLRSSMAWTPMEEAAHNSLRLDGLHGVRSSSGVSEQQHYQVSINRDYFAASAEQRRASLVEGRHTR